jgi:hypothetical protein
VLENYDVLVEFSERMEIPQGNAFIKGVEVKKSVLVNNMQEVLRKPFFKSRITKIAGFLRIYNFVMISIQSNFTTLADIWVLMGRICHFIALKTADFDICSWQKHMVNGN